MLTWFVVAVVVVVVHSVSSSSFVHSSLVLLLPGEETFLSILLAIPPSVCIVSKNTRKRKAPTQLGSPTWKTLKPYLDPLNHTL